MLFVCLSIIIIIIIIIGVFQLQKVIFFQLVDESIKHYLKMDGEISKPFLFSIKKWSVIILCALNIILMIIYASISNLLANRYLYDYEIDRDYRIEEVKVS